MHREYRLAQFYVAVSEHEAFGPFLGYTNGEVSKSGYPTPVFTKSLADGIVDAWNYAYKEFDMAANYDSDLNAYVFHGDNDDCVAFEGYYAALPYKCGLQNVYPIGRNEWQWEEAID